MSAAAPARFPAPAPARFAGSDGAGLRFPRFAGSPAAIGRAHGLELAGDIAYNLALLLEEGGLGARLDANARYQRWRERQAEATERFLPGAIAEMEAIAAASGHPLHRLLDLAFCGGWEHFEDDAGEAATCCSTVAVRSKDGALLCASTLDDPWRIWPCPVACAPERGRSYVTTVWPGTSWAGRGMNDAGLCLNTAGLGLRKTDRAHYRDGAGIHLGFALRAMLSECADVGDVRRYCAEHPFTMNLVAVDRHGGLFAAHLTEEGPVEVGTPDRAALTNTVEDDVLAWRFARAGYTLYPEHPTSRARHGRLQAFLADRTGKTTLAETAGLFAARDASDPGAICHPLTAWVTAASPSEAPGTYWMLRPNDPDAPTAFTGLPTRAGKEA